MCSSQSTVHAKGLAAKKLAASPSDRMNRKRCAAFCRHARGSRDPGRWDILASWIAIKPTRRRLTHDHSTHPHGARLRNGYPSSRGDYGCATGHTRNSTSSLARTSGHIAQFILPIRSTQFSFGLSKGNFPAPRLQNSLAGARKPRRLSKGNERFPNEWSSGFTRSSQSRLSHYLVT